MVPEFGRYGAPASQSPDNEFSPDVSDGSSEEDRNDESGGDDQPESDIDPDIRQEFEISDGEDDRNAMELLRQPQVPQYAGASDTVIDPTLRALPRKRAHQKRKVPVEVSDDEKEFNENPVQVSRNLVMRFILTLCSRMMVLPRTFFKIIGIRTVHLVHLFSMEAATLNHRLHPPNPSWPPSTSGFVPPLPNLPQAPRQISKYRQLRINQHRQLTVPHATLVDH